jgi:hypothetical protein
MPNWNQNPNVQALVTLAAGNDDVLGKVWAKKLDVATTTSDDFKMLEGPPGSAKPVWKNTDLTAVPGEAIVVSVLSAPGGPGVRGEQPLLGSESTFRIGAYRVPIEFWRDAVTLTKSQIKKLAMGPKLRPTILEEVGKKLGRQKQRDMMLKLIITAKAQGNLMRPNNRSSSETIVSTDTLTLSLLVQAKTMLQSRGGQPISIQTDKNGSPVYRYMPFCTLNALQPVRDSDTYQNALELAMERGYDNPLFSGKLVPWQNLEMFEHTPVIADADDVQGSPLEPLALLGVAVSAGSTSFAVHASATAENETTPFYFIDFPGYPLTFADTDVAPAPDTATHYFWIYNPPTSTVNPGLAGFFSYTGSANLGTYISGVTGILNSYVSGLANTTVGGVTWDPTKHCTSFGPGAYIVPAYKTGAPRGYSLVFGAGGAFRTYGEMTALPIEMKQDYDFVQGFGYESVWGQGARVDTKGYPRHYMLIEQCIQREGIPVPGN